MRIDAGGTSSRPKPMKSPPLSLIEADLTKRINPEKSRRFNRKRLIQSQLSLADIYSHDELKQQGLSISVVGSNGKGSLAFLLMAKAYQYTPFYQAKIGLFTSPHLLSVLERIRICTGLSAQDSLCPSPIPAESAWEAMCALQKIIPQYYKDLSYFELLSVLAVYLFNKNHCDLQIYEAGLGGRFDATRAIQPQVVVLTSITKEHTDLLGTELKQILKEKLGILGKNSHSLFCLTQPELGKQEIVALARKIAPQLKKIYFFNQQKKTYQSYLEENQAFADFILQKLAESGHSPLPPHSHQPIDKQIQEAHFTIPGRLEKHSFSLPQKRSCELIFDIAHNPPAIERVLADLLRNSQPRYCDVSLVVLALLMDRAVGPCLLPIDQAGFIKIWQVVGKGWAPSYQIPTGQIRVQPIQSDQLVDSLALSLSTYQFERLIFLGTHRTYNCFIALIKKLRKFG